MERGLAVLNLVANSTAPLTVRAIADRLALNTTTTYHLVNTLRAAQYLDRDAVGNVRCGPAIALLSAAYERSGTRRARVLRIVEDLAARTGETAYLAVAEARGVGIRCVFEGTKSLRVGGLEVGFMGDEHLRASGKAVLAYLPENERREILEQRLRHELSDATETFARLECEFTRIRRRGTAVDDGEFEMGICCVSAPFFDYQGRVLGALSLSGPSVRSEQLFGEYAAATIEAAHRVTAVHGGVVRELEQD